MTKDMNPHELGAFGAYAAEAIANQIADDRDHWKARAERAEAEAAALRAQRDAALRKEEGIFDSAAETELRLNATIDALRAELAAARATGGWRPVTMPLPVTDADIEIVLKARVNDQGLWAFRTMVPVIAWRLDPEWRLDPAAPDAAAGQE